MYAYASSSTTSSPNSPSSLTSFSTALATFDVSTHGEGPFPKPLIREDSWNRIPLEYRPLTPQPGGRWRRSSHRDVPAEYRSGDAQPPRRHRSAEGESRGWNQHRCDQRRGVLSTSSGNSDGDKTGWLAALVSTVKRPKHNRRESPHSINISPDRPRTAITTPPLPSPAASAMTTTAATITTTYLAPPPSTTVPPCTDSVVWDPTTQVWRRLVPTPRPTSTPIPNNHDRNRSRNRNPSDTPAFTFPYSDYTQMTESERLDYFLDHRVASVVDSDEASFRVSHGEESGDEAQDEGGLPPPPYVQSQWEAVQERRMRRMQERAS